MRAAALHVVPPSVERVAYMSSLPLRPSAHIETIVPVAWLAAVDGMVLRRQFEPGTMFTPVMFGPAVLGLAKLCPPSVDLPTPSTPPGAHVAMTLPLGSTTGIENCPPSNEP